MSRSTISTYRIFQLYPDEATARTYLESRRWPAGAVCPACNEASRITPRPKGFYRCNACKRDFTVRTETIFERSHIPLNKWIYAMYLLMTARKGISSLQIGKEIGVTQKSAWFMLQRIREACGDNGALRNGIIESGARSPVGIEATTEQPNKKLGVVRRAVTKASGIRKRTGRNARKATAKPLTRAPQRLSRARRDDLHS